MGPGWRPTSAFHGRGTATSHLGAGPHAKAYSTASTGDSGALRGKKATGCVDALVGFARGPFGGGIEPLGQSSGCNGTSAGEAAPQDCQRENGGSTGLDNVNKQVALYEASWTSYVDQLLERDKQLGKLQEAGRAWSAQLRDATALLKQAAATDVAEGLSSTALPGADDADMEAEVSKAEAVVQEQQARHAVSGVSSISV